MKKRTKMFLDHRGRMSLLNFYRRLYQLEYWGICNGFEEKLKYPRLIEPSWDTAGFILDHWTCRDNECVPYVLLEPMLHWKYRLAIYLQLVTVVPEYCTNTLNISHQLIFLSWPLSSFKIRFILPLLYFFKSWTLLKNESHRVLHSLHSVEFMIFWSLQFSLICSK